MTKLIWLAAAALVLSGASAHAQSAAAKAAVEACKPDIAHFCANVKPGGGRIKACLKHHAAELSPGCKEAAYKAWLVK